MLLLLKRKVSAREEWIIQINLRILINELSRNFEEIFEEPNRFAENKISYLTLNLKVTQLRCNIHAKALKASVRLPF